MTLKTSLPSDFPSSGLVTIAQVRALSRKHHLSVKNVRQEANKRYALDHNPEIRFRRICALSECPVFIPDFRKGDEDVRIQEIGAEHFRHPRHKRWFQTIRKAGLVPFVRDWDQTGELWLCGRIEDWKAFRLKDPVAEDYSGRIV